MALFKAENLLKDESKERVIKLDCYKMPKGEETPTLTITVNHKTREAYNRGNRQYITPKITRPINRNELELTPKNKTTNFIMDILRAEQFVLSPSLIDKPSVAAIEAHLNRASKAAIYWASKLTEVFEEEEHIKKEAEEEDEKN